VELITRLSSVAGCTVLDVRGEIDLATLPELHNAVTKAVMQARRESIVIDLDGVYACDDAGLGVLLGAAGRARQDGGDVVVVCTDGALRTRLARTGFDRAVNVTSSIADAIELVTAAPGEPG
jgi:anti-sigma B factor antagonist